jgi:aspartate aminotransferase-like enzyme
VQASETSTGAAHPIRELAAITASRPDTILVVDAITALGVFDVPTDAWGLDVVVCGSQKALMLPPGLAFASVSEKAWRLGERARTPRFYFDWRRERKKQETADVAFTPAVSLFVGLREALRMMKDEGLPAIFARHDSLARATRAGAQAIGLSLYATAPSASVTAVNAPPGVDSQKIVSTMRDRYGVAIAGGQDQAKGKIIRLAHLGHFDRFDIITALSALEMALGDLGHHVQLGASIAAAEAVFAASARGAAEGAR